MTDGPGRTPEPTTEPREKKPGGADSVDDPKYGQTLGEPTVPELPPTANPAAAEMPEEITEPDDKRQEPDDGADADVGADRWDTEPEPPA